MQATAIPGARTAAATAAARVKVANFDMCALLDLERPMIRRRAP
jgi:hypothetical protein